MANNYFKFKQFTIFQDKCAMKVGTDGVLLGAWSKSEDKDKVLDIGTGTGLIALMLAQQSNCIVNAIEIDQSAFHQAKENVKNSAWNNRIKVYHSSFQEYCNSNTNKYDLIVSNPPYFKNSLLTTNEQRAIARHDVSLSHADIINGVNILLKDDACFNIILPYTEGNVFIAEAALKTLFCVRKTNILPVPKSRPKRLLLQFKKEKMPLIEDSLVIENYKRHNYSDEYKELTKDYYLFF